MKGESHACIMCFSFSTCSCCCCSTMTFFLSFFKAKLLFRSDLSVTNSTRPNPPTPNVSLVSKSIKVKLAYSLVHFFGVNERFCFSYSANQSLLRISSRLPRWFRNDLAISPNYIACLYLKHVKRTVLKSFID